MSTTTLDRVTELAPLIAERSEEIERARRVPLDLLDDLRIDETQHVAATREFYAIVGAVLAGEEVPVTRI